MKGRALAFAVLSALSAGAMAEGYTYQQNPNAIGPNTAVPDNGSATAVQPNPVLITREAAQSGPGAVDKTRPGYPDTSTTHSTWDVGTSSAGG